MKELDSCQWCPVTRRGNEQKLKYRTFCLGAGKKFPVRVI